MKPVIIGSATLHSGNCLEVMRGLPSASIDAIVTDPPYELGFMGKTWDASGIAYSVEMWAEALRVLKPGGHLLAFSGSRTYHRMTCAIEDAGFDVRDQIMWVYGSGFPKSLDVSKAIDKAAGAEREVIGFNSASRIAASSDARNAAQGKRAVVYNEETGAPITAPATDAARQWEGWGTALKPAHEPICVARKPLVGTVAANVLAHGTGALNIDGCRVGTSKNVPASPRGTQDRIYGAYGAQDGRESGHNPNIGRWPANLIHDGSDEVRAAFPGDRRSGTGRREEDNAARFFYCAKASKQDREDGNIHPTVKPTELMRYLVRMVTPPSGVVLDMFMGSGSTGKACALEGCEFVGIDMTPEYVAISRARIEQAQRVAQEQDCEPLQKSLL